MNRRTLLQGMGASLAAFLGLRPLPARPRDQRYVRGDLVRVIGTVGTSTWWADAYKGEIKRVVGSYRDLYGSPVYRVRLGPGRHGVNDPAYQEAVKKDRAKYERDCRKYSLVELDGSGERAWWDEECLEAMKPI